MSTRNKQRKPPSEVTTAVKRGAAASGWSSDREIDRRVPVVAQSGISQNTNTEQPRTAVGVPMRGIPGRG